MLIKPFICQLHKFAIITRIAPLKAPVNPVVNYCGPHSRERERRIVVCVRALMCYV